MLTTRTARCKLCLEPDRVGVLRRPGAWSRNPPWLNLDGEKNTCGDVQRAPCSALKKMAGFPGLFPASVLPALLLWVSMWGSPASGFSVMGPAQPIKVPLGADATLPCQLSPEQSAAHMQIRWYRAQLSPAVLVYQNGQEQDGEQMLEYRGRTELAEDSIGRGAVALLIQHVRASDDGQYWCHFNDGHISQEAAVELHVIGLGSAPHVRMMGPEDNGIQVLCSSGGWFPKPRVQWSDMAGGKLLSLSESQSQDGDGLFHVEASLVVKDSSLGNVTCSIQNPVSGQEKASAIFLPEPFFPRTSPWKTALAGTLPVLVLLLIGISYTGWRQHKAKNREVKERKEASHERAKMAKEKEEAYLAKRKLEEDLEQRKALYNKDWKKALIYPDWRKEQFEHVSVSVNHENVHQNNSDFTKETQAVLCNKQGGGNLLKLDQKGFTKGRYYWEVDLEDTDEWTLGIYDEPTEKSELPNDLREMKFNVLEKKGCEYRALTCSCQGISKEESLLIEKCPQKIVIFLDYEDSNISFYNMIDGTHIFSFNQAHISGSVYPYFKLKSMEFSPSA
ncbi:butyrophilin-like protein 1 isoform X1 [Dama dama]|uniref:butyrophilin-like protein 1 isoform X1 n=1 Tax=Dama dama TaxID=30532 RepID=UPI002A366F1E|nr:butyrophilin-like protein 1 isoform X1 [Dama dama]